MWCSTHSHAKSAVVVLLCLVLQATAWANPEQVATSQTAMASAPAATSANSIGGAHPQLPGSKLQGQATMRFWGMRVYQARLWTAGDFRAERITEQPLVLELQYLLDLNGQAIAERSLKEIQRAASIESEQAQRWLTTMQRIFPDVKSGERLTGVLKPGIGVVFWHNDRKIAEVPDADFARRFFGIWLAPTTSEPNMRLALLGLKESGER